MEEGREVSGILALIGEALSIIDRGLSCVCCTVAATRGSTPQKAGAMMLVFADGTQSGTLGGGCVEAEVKQRALAALSNQEITPGVHVFQLNDDYGWDDGLICGGQMTIAVEPLTPAHSGYFRKLAAAIEGGSGCTELIALPGNPQQANPGSRLLFNDRNQLAATTNAAIVNVPFERRTRPAVIDGFAMLPTPPRIRLLIVGGGHVGQAVAALAHTLDFEVWIVDDRDKFADSERFPYASRRIVGDIGRELQQLKAAITPNTYCLIVTRGHSHDEEALYHLVTSDAGYIGMIGSKRKVRLIFDDLRVKGISDEALARVRAPIGLDIGSQTVPEIAVSILAELIARRNLGAIPSTVTVGPDSKE